MSASTCGLRRQTVGGGKEARTSGSLELTSTTVDAATMIHKVAPMYVVVYVVSECKLLRGPADDIEINIVDIQFERLESGEREGRRGLLDMLELAGGSRGGSQGDQIWTCWRGGFCQFL